MMDFSKLTNEELEKAKEIVNAEINKRHKEEKEERREELEKLLNRVNELQDKYDFEIDCEDDDGYWVSSVSNFELKY
jgi:hypothetical protein